MGYYAFVYTGYVYYLPLSLSPCLLAWYSASVSQSVPYGSWEYS